MKSFDYLYSFEEIIKDEAPRKGTCIWTAPVLSILLIYIPFSALFSILLFIRLVNTLKKVFFSIFFRHNELKLINEHIFFQSSSDSEDGEIRTSGRFEGSSSSDEEILNTGSGRLAMKPIGRKPTTFKMDVVDDWPLVLIFHFQIGTVNW